MQVVFLTITIFLADRIFYGAGTIVEAMDQLFFVKKMYCPGNGGFIHAIQFIFQISQTECSVKIPHGSQNQYPG